MFTPSDTFTVPSPLSTIPSSLATICTCICASSPTIVYVSPIANAGMPSIMFAASCANCCRIVSAAVNFSLSGYKGSSIFNIASGDICSSSPVSASRTIILSSEALLSIPLPSSYCTRFPLITYTRRSSCFIVAPCIRPVV